MSDVCGPELGLNLMMQGGREAVVKRLCLWVHSTHCMSGVATSKAVACACLTMLHYQYKPQWLPKKAY